MLREMIAGANISPEYIFNLYHIPSYRHLDLINKSIALESALRKVKK